MPLCLVLHAHLPYVAGTDAEDWFHEAVVECYVPLARVLRGARVALSISPTLGEMLADGALRARTLRWIDRFEERLDRVRGFDAAVARLRRLAADARSAPPEFPVPEMTTAVTHAFLPSLLPESARRAQIRAGVRNHARRFGRRPRGFWLPECGYAPGIDRMLADEGIEYFFVDAHAQPGPIARTPAGPVSFARDAEASRRVWSATEGYPGDPAYREFHHAVEGHKVFRVTGRAEKEPYDPEAAGARARAHAAHFASSVRGLVIAPFDAELFGHWWFEGPVFLEHLLRNCETVLPSEVDVSGAARREPALSSWGEGGCAQVWIDPSNEWVLREVHRATARYLAEGGSDEALRELLLAQASDWPFLIRAGTNASFAAARVRHHLARFEGRLAGPPPPFPEADRSLFEE